MLRIRTGFNAEPDTDLDPALFVNADPDPADQNECGSVRIWIRILKTAWEAWFCIINNLHIKNTPINRYTLEKNGF